MKFNMCLILLAVFFSCKHSEKQNHILNLEDKVHKIFYSEFTDSLFTVQLETTEDCLLGEIEQVLKDDTLLFLLDKKQKTIFIFSDSGKYIRKIDFIGKGEGEYISASSFCINPRRKQVYLFDQTQKKLLVYGYDGSFIHTIKSQNLDIIRNIALSENENIICFTPDLCAPHARDGIWEVKLDGSFGKQYRIVDPKHKFGWIGDHYSNCEGKISFYDSFTNELLTFNNSDFVTEYLIDLKQAMPESYLNIQDGVNHQGTDKYYMNVDIAENDSHYYLKFRSNKMGDVHVFFNKITNSFTSADSIINDLKGNSPSTFFTYSKNALGVLAWGNDPFYNPELQVLYLKKI